MSALEAAGIRTLNEENDRVSFVAEDDPKGKGKRATELKKITLVCRGNALAVSHLHSHRLESVTSAR